MIAYASRYILVTVITIPRKVLNYIARAKYRIHLEAYIKKEILCTMREKLIKNKEPNSTSESGNEDIKSGKQCRKRSSNTIKRSMCVY